MFEKVKGAIEKIKSTGPLVLNLTNNVTMGFVANGLLSIGASPIMSQGEEELEDLLKISNILVINTGTLNKNFLKLCDKACDLANKQGVPIIFDPVGAGATRYRTVECQKLLKKFHISIIRGNASEISALYGEKITTKGVDSTQKSEYAKDSAKKLSLLYNTTVCISGEIDIVVSGQNNSQFARGSSIMTSLTGTGCLLSAVVGAFHAVEKNSYDAACAAVLFYAVCGENAAKLAPGPGSFHVRFLDELNAGLCRVDYEKN